MTVDRTNVKDTADRAGEAMRKAARKEAVKLVNELCPDTSWGYYWKLVDLITVRLTDRAAEAAALREALSPFAEVGRKINRSVADIHVMAEIDTLAPIGTVTTLTAKDFRKAAKVCAPPDDGSTGNGSRQP